MPFVKHDSSQIHSTNYDPIEQVLEARFACSSCRKEVNPDCPKCKGAGFTSTYRYYGIPPEAYAAVRDAKLTDPNGSHGRAFSSAIKKPGYKYERLP